VCSSTGPSTFVRDYLSALVLSWILIVSCADGCHIIGSYVRQLKEEQVGYGNMTPWATENGRDVILPTEDSEEGTALPMDKM
jgi:hypothetical protein